MTVDCHTVLALRCRGLAPGGRPTFFASPKKVGKERRPCSAARPSVGCPAMLATWAPRPTHYATLRSDRGREVSSRGSLRSRSQAAALLGGFTRATKSIRLAFGIASRGAARRTQHRGDAQRAESSSPCEAAEKRRNPRRVRSTHQLLTRAALFERSVAKRVRRGLGFRASQRTRSAAEGGGAGALSLLPFLCVQERESPAGASPGTVANDGSPQ